MQTTTTNTDAIVHVKVAFQDEFRRFLLKPISFQHLDTTLRKLFNLEGEFRVKFQDDENDWVLLATDQELLYAIELSGSPLRLQLKSVDDAPLTASAESQSIPARVGRGRGRGGRDCKGARIPPEERLTRKTSRLTERIAELESKLNSNTKLTSDRERVFRWRLVKLQEKLDTIKAMKESLTKTGIAPANPTESVRTTEEPENVHMRCYRGRGRGGRRGRMEGDHPCKKVSPEILANLRQCKANLRAAKESGNAEKVAACSEALQAAKKMKWNALDALRAQEEAPNTP